ncbi:hypothetical protein C5167_012694 [Papaver somniferum]|uniref:Uncharacterized protein n=1 Tax=Papaver somniferum TaxID=3469 RepID=A0A4Y7IY72_PAPSO|nr:hypothetical protein C5167_012694 [Papaver somniferum]
MGQWALKISTPLHTAIYRGYLLSNKALLKWDRVMAQGRDIPLMLQWSATRRIALEPKKSKTHRPCSMSRTGPTRK